MNVFEALIIGLMQGLTEFLPVSSSGHMLLAGRIMGQMPSLAFELVMHLATLAAVIVVYRSDIWGLIKKPLCREVRLLAVATVPTVAIVLLGESLFRASFDGRFLSYCFLITGIVLIASGFSHKKPAKAQMGYLDALVIGTAQGLAAFPGISRSGATISAAALLNNDKKSSARFSFLLSIPVILGSAAVELITNDSGLGAVSFLPLAVGFLAAFISGYIALRLVIKILSKYNFDGFAVYLLLLATFLLMNDFVLHLF